MKASIKNVIVLIFVILFSFSASVHAGYKIINKETVEHFIFKDKIFKILQNYIPLHTSGFKKGIKQGMWDKKGNIGFYGIDEFSNVDFFRISRTSVILKKRPGVKIKITGAYDIDSVRHFKVVEFTYQYSGVSSTAKRFIVKGGSGGIIFAKYDDGFRFHRIKVKASREPFPLTNKELAAQNNHIETLRRNRLKRESFIAKRLKEAKRDGAVKGLFDTTYNVPVYVFYRIVARDIIEVSDNYIQIKRNKHNLRNAKVSRYPDSFDVPRNREYRIWMGGIKSVKRQGKVELRDKFGEMEAYRIVINCNSYGRVLIYLKNNEEYQRFYKLFLEVHRKWNKKYKTLKLTKK